jgi:hypothetical protein
VPFQSSRNKVCYSDVHFFSSSDEIYLISKQDMLKVFSDGRFQQHRIRMANHPAPWALRKLFEHLKHKYRNPPVLIYENGELLNWMSRLSDHSDHFSVIVSHSSDVLVYND